MRTADLQSCTTLCTIFEEVEIYFSPSSQPADFIGDKPAAPIKHPKSLFLDPLSCILDGESTPNRETGPNKEGRALLGRISLVKWKVTICSCPTREQQTLSRPLLRYPRAYIFLSVALRDPFLLSPFAAFVRATHEKHVCKTVRTCNR